jgi:prevent-host-death family protein
MITVGAFEAKTNFSKLLDRVQAGEQVTITRNGKIVARLVSPSDDAERRREAVEGLRKLRKGSSLGGLSWKDLRDEGRKY